MTKGSLILLSSVMILVSTLTCRATCPDSIRQQKMLEEEQAFLANMKPGLQHIQMMAVRKAMEGNDTELQQIRQSRNQPPTLPEGVKTFYPRENICLFSPKHETDRKRPILLYLHGGGWCFGSINSCARFCAAIALEADCPGGSIRLSSKHLPTPTLPHSKIVKGQYVTCKNTRPTGEATPR